VVSYSPGKGGEADVPEVHCYIKVVSYSPGKGGEADVEKAGNRSLAIPDLPGMGVVHTVHKCVLTARLQPERSTFCSICEVS